MLHLSLVLLLVTSMLVGCASMPPSPVATMARPAPADLMLPCLPPEATTSPSADDYFNACMESKARLNTCKQRHESLVDWVRAGYAAP